MTDIVEQYSKLIKEHVSFYGISGAKKIAKDKVINSLYDILNDEQLSQEKKLNTVVDLLKMMRL